MVRGGKGGVVAARQLPFVQRVRVVLGVVRFEHEGGVIARGEHPGDPRGSRAGNPRDEDALTGDSPRRHRWTIPRGWPPAASRESDSVSSVAIIRTGSSAGP